MDADFAQTFRRRLAETIAWCSVQPSLATAPELLAARRSDFLERWRKDYAARFGPLPSILRTPQLEPRGFEYPATATQRAEIMERLVEMRAAMLRDAGIYPTAFCGDLAGGRLLLHGPDYTDSSGGSLVAPGGFLDWWLLR